MLNFFRSSRLSSRPRGAALLAACALAALSLAAAASPGPHTRVRLLADAGVRSVALEASREE